MNSYTARVQVYIIIKDQVVPVPIYLWYKYRVNFVHPKCKAASRLQSVDLLCRKGFEFQSPSCNRRRMLRDEFEHSISKFFLYLMVWESTLRDMWPAAQLALPCGAICPAQCPARCLGALLGAQLTR